MKITKEELSLINFSLKTTGEAGQDGAFVGRTFLADKLKLAIDVFGKMKANTTGDEFIDGEVEFTTEEKMFVLEMIDRAWALQDGTVKISLEEKLK